MISGLFKRPNMDNNKTGETPNTKTELKVEKPKTLVVARQHSFVFKSKGIWPFKTTPKPIDVDPIVNKWMEEMAKNGQPVGIGKYFSCNGDLVYLFMYSERINLD